MKYPISEQDREKFNEFMDYANSEGEGSLKHTIRSLICDKSETLEEQRKSTLIVASIMSNVVIHTFNALEEASRKHKNGCTDQMFDRNRMKQLNQELNELTSSGSYESLTNQSAMRKLYSALTDFLNDSMK